MEEIEGNFWPSTLTFTGDETTGSALNSCVRHVSLQLPLFALIVEDFKLPDSLFERSRYHQCQALEFGKLVRIDPFGKSVDGIDLVSTPRIGLRTPSRKEGNVPLK